MLLFHLIPLAHWVAVLLGIEIWLTARRRHLPIRPGAWVFIVPAAMALVSMVVQWSGRVQAAGAAAGWIALFDALAAGILLAGLIWMRRCMIAACKMNEQLAHSEVEYRTIFSMTGTAIMIIDGNDMIELVNYEFERLSGLARQELQGKMSWSSFFNGEMLNRLMEDHRLRKRYLHAVPSKYETYFIDKLGNQHEVFINISMFPGSQRAVFSLQDMTEQKQTVQALQNAEERYRGIFEHAIEGIFQTTIDGRYLHANPTLARIYGYESPAELIHHLNDIKTQLYVEPARRDDFVREIQMCGEVRNFESQIYRKNGEVIWISENARGVYNDADELCYFEGMVEDITEKKMSELALQAQYQLLQKTIDELETAQSTLVEQERLRALGQMASGIAHDFNNTLSPILGFTELLLKRPKNLEDKEKVRRYLEMIHTAAQDASNVVRCLREFYRLRNDQEINAPVDVNAVISESIQLTQPRWRNQAQASGVNIHVATDLRELPLIYGVESSLRDALTNLIFNAVDAMPEGGTLTLASRMERQLAMIEVCDTGIGMDPETRKRCLEPFFTTKGSRGTGLGLAMVYGVVNRHAGTIEIESEPGRGTLVRICLPARDREKKAAVMEEAPPPEQRLRVLLLEDDAMVREVISEYLAGDGYEVTTAVNGRDGLEKYDPALFDLVVTDKSMPEISGDQVAAEIRKRNSAQAVIMLTGFGDMMDAVGELPIGIDAVVSKPVTLETLRRAIRQVMGEREKASE